MKKTNFIKTILISVFALMLTGCFDPIFSEIRKDVKPESATVSGNITSITRYTAGGEEYLVLSADGGIRYKLADNEEHDSWNVYENLPFELAHFDYEDSVYEGEQILKVLANSDTLYLVCAIYEATGWEGKSNPASFCIWSKQISAANGIWSTSGDWSKVDTSAKNYFPLAQDSSEYYYSNFNVFQTNTPLAKNRHAYLCTYDVDAGTVEYNELTGLETLKAVKIEKLEDDSTNSRAYSAAYFDGSILFFNSVAVVTDETYTDEATTIYYGGVCSSDNDYSALYYKKAGSESYTELKYDLDKKTTFSALAVCKDSIIMGCGNIASGSGKGGVRHALLTDGVPQSIIDEFDSNASTQLSSAYYVMALLNATPEKTEAESALYAALSYSETSGYFDNVGLWSYYPERGNWNRE